MLKELQNINVNNSLLCDCSITYISSSLYLVDYIFFNFHVILPPYKNSTCATLYIVNDNIKETLYEAMHMYIFRVIPWNRNLHVDYTWSTVRIQDDDN